MAEQIIKERWINEDGKWEAKEKPPSDDTENAVKIQSLILQSKDKTKEATIQLANDGVVLLVIDGVEYRILVAGINSQSGEVVFENTKSMRIDFEKPFNNTPSIALTLADQSATPAYRYYPGSNGFTVRFQSNYSGIVGWHAMEAK